MTDQLSLYNGALSILGERRLASLTENREPRYKLDDIYENDLVNRVLQMGQWKFAKRSVQLEPEPSISPAFGLQFAYPLPDDFVRTIKVCYDEYFNIPITRYEIEAKVIYTDADEIFFSYVSDDEAFGGDFSLWPFNFTEMVEHYLAYKVGPRLTGISMTDKELLRLYKFALSEAKAVDAMESPAKFPPKGGWARSRKGFRRGNQERGNRSQLIG